MRPLRPLRRDEFEVALICALPLEYNAAFLIFDELWDEEGDQYGKATGDPNVYTTGRIGNHNAVLALLPHMGKVNAASAAASIHSSYPNLQIAILVGVCGAAPRSKNGEILLGDVIISKAVVQYDFGRQYPDRFLRKDTMMDGLGQPSKVIRNLLAIFQTDRMADWLEQQTGNLLQTLQDEVAQTKRRGKYDYPGTTKDKLFESNYRHKHYNNSMVCVCHSCEKEADPTCEEAINSSCEKLGCHESHLVVRQRLQAKQETGQDKGNIIQKPMIHFGLVASGDSVIKSAVFRDKLSSEVGVIGFEMESAGIWGDLPCIVIKGVCDYADSHKHKGWQDFAAAVAACTSKAILERFVLATKVATPPSDNSIETLNRASEAELASRIIPLVAQFERDRNALEALMKCNHQEISGGLGHLATQLSHLGLRILGKPAILREICDVAVDPDSTGYLQPTHAQNTLDTATCRCSLRPRAPKTSYKRIGTGLLELFSKEENTFVHLPGCPYHKRLSTKTSAGTIFKLKIGRMVNVLVEASLSYAAGGAGGFSISPNINIQVMVHESPADEVFIQLINQLCDPDLQKPSDVTKLFRSAENKLLRLFDDRVASPYEVSKNGESHLHLLLKILRFVPHFSLDKYSVKSQVRQMIRNLVAAGVPCNITTPNHEDIYDYALGYTSVLTVEDIFANTWAPGLEFQASILSALIEMDGINSVKSGDILVIRSQLDGTSGFDDILNNDQISPLERAVLMKSEKDVLSILERDPESLKRTIIGGGILNIALQWPPGLSLLLSRGGTEIIDKSERGCLAPIELACSIKCVEAVRILLAADCTLEMGYSTKGVGLILTWTSLECAREVTKTLADRRRRLFQLARKILLVSHIRKFKCSDGSLPDIEAIQLIEAIENAGGRVPACLTAGPIARSVYHERIRKAFFPLLFDAGFRDLSERSVVGLLPIMIRYGQDVRISEYWNPLLSIVSVMPWVREHCLLDERPTDPISLGLNTSATGWHYLATELGHTHEYHNPITHRKRRNAEKLIQQFAEEVFEKCTTDDCQCWCSEGGCTPFILYCKTQAKREWNQYKSSVILNNLFQHGDKSKSKLDEETHQSLAKQFIRLLTFEALEMTHTCCHYWNGRIFYPAKNQNMNTAFIKKFEGDSKDIREEEAELASRLTRLLDGFWPEYISSGEPLMNFMWEKWRRHMTAECVPSNEEQDQIAAAGLTVDREYATPDAVWNLLDGLTFSV